MIHPSLFLRRALLADAVFSGISAVALTFGAGEQIALTTFHTYSHALVLTARIPF